MMTGSSTGPCEKGPARPPTILKEASTVPTVLSISLTRTPERLILMPF